MTSAAVTARLGPERTCLVTGVGGPAGRAAVRALRARGLRVVATDMRRVAHEADEFHDVPPVASPEYLARLDELLTRFRASWLVPTVQDELVLIAQHAHSLRRAGVAVFIGDPRAVAICHDKWETVQRLQSLGVRVPRSVVAHGTYADIACLGVPLVSKPRVGRGGRGVVVHEAPQVLMQGQDVIWQAFLPGVEYDVTLLIHPDQPFRVLSLDCFAKTRMREGRTGNGMELTPCVAADVADLAVQAASALALTGPCDIDIRRDEDGAPHVLEINARIGAHAFSAPRLFDAMVELHAQGHLG